MDDLSFLTGTLQGVGNGFKITNNGFIIMVLHHLYVKIASKKVGALIRTMKFLSPVVALCLYKSTICPCLEYCCHVWAGAPSCYLELLNKIQKRMCRTVVPSLAASLEPLAHC